MNRYGCHNHPQRKPGYLAQDGWFLDGVTRTPRMVKVKDAMSKDCQYSKDPALGQKDERCTGCKWRADAANA